MLMPPVSRYMTMRPFTIAPTTSIADAHRVMIARKVRHLPVVGADGLCGVVSDRDLHIFESLSLGNSNEVPVADVMIANPCVVDPQTPLDEAVDMMAEQKIGSVVVVGKTGVAGIFTAVDACAALAQVLRLATA